VKPAPEQEARDLLERLSSATHYIDPQRLSSGDVVELANLFAEIERLDGELCDARHGTELANSEVAGCDQEIEHLKEELSRHCACEAELRRGYTATSLQSWPCPGCKYENGVFVESCGLHQQIERLARQNAELRKRLDTITIPVPNAETVEQLQGEIARLTKRHADIVGELYGQGFEILGWHLNGNAEPLDSWFEDNDWLDDEAAEASGGD